MRTLMTLLIFATVLSIVSAITGIQSFRADQGGTVIWYWHGYGRLYALAYAVGFAVAFYGVYRRYPVVWRLGWVVLCLSCAQGVFMVWRSTRTQADARVIAALSAFAGLAVALYWGNWWRKQRSYFFSQNDEPI